MMTRNRSHTTPLLTVLVLASTLACDLGDENLGETEDETESTTTETSSTGESTSTEEGGETTETSSTGESTSTEEGGETTTTEEGESTTGEPAGCDPLVQDCPEGEGCHPDDFGFTCLAQLLDMGPGQPCSYVEECAPGNVCVVPEVVPGCSDMNGAGCCTPFCDLGLGDEPCTAVVPGTTCEPFFEAEALPGYEHVGMCVAV